jgi:hypothetical protein
VLRALQEEFGGLRAELGAGERRKLSQLLTRRRAQIQPTAFGLK